ncbi:Permease of the drug/metabolite transporter (DMT) superfamily [Pseudomonas sp. OF001]|uniref:DMT family transporter n=1 Tax=Pseudomonas sp. OF001 TaxID=2772300 RepID=UPI001918B70D|nr:DMT family transporter [Pseudomonas sp. OF001]CAD5377266.1 Permease of the drug/metabolite transporter (DMT) superfamily [Pseudomonas sp. OF001]
MTPRNALLAVHLGALLFGLTGVFGKLAEAAPLAITAGRAAFAVLALGLFLALARNASAGRPSLRQLALLVLGGLLLGAHWLTFFHAVKVSGVAIATLGFASFPAFTLLLEGLLFRERLRAGEFAVVGLVCLGLVLVTPQFELASQASQGLLWAVLSGLLFALLSLTNRVSARGIEPAQAALWQNLTIALCLLPLTAPQLPAIAPLDWLWLALLGVLCTGLAHSLFVSSLRVLKARTAAVVFAMEPVYGIFFAWLLFAEIPSLRILGGGALIVLATFVSARLPR